MSKPLGYFCSFKHNDGSFIDKLEQEYGSNLELLNEVQKLRLLAQLAISLENVAINKVGTLIAQSDVQEIANLTTAIYKKLPIGEHLPLIKAIIENL